MGAGVIEHLRSDGTSCRGCDCENSEIPHNTGDILLVGCCAMRYTHGTFRFDDETGDCTQWPVCCAEHVHTGPDVPDGYCAAHGVTRPEHTVVLTARGPILGLDEPEIRLPVAALAESRPNDPVLEATLSDGRKVGLPSALALRDPKYGGPIPGEVVVRGYILLRSGSLIPTVDRQFAQKRIDALFRRIQRAAFEYVYSPKEREMLVRSQGRALATIHSRKERLMGVALRADLDDGRIDLSITSQAHVVNRFNPENGGIEWHHVSPLEREVAVVAPALAARMDVRLGSELVAVRAALGAN